LIFFNPSLTRRVGVRVRVDSTNLGPLRLVSESSFAFYCSPRFAEWSNGAAGSNCQVVSIGGIGAA
jgi:hypothetical protein